MKLKAKTKDKTVGPQAPVLTRVPQACHAWWVAKAEAEGRSLASLVRHRLVKEWKKGSPA